MTATYLLRSGLVCLALSFPAFGPRDTCAQGRIRFARPTPVAGPPAAVVTPAAPRSAAPLGSGFFPTPYIFTRGNAPAGGGYSPLGQFGDTTMALYGPLSGLRYSSAPVMTYSRGYNGATVVTPGTSFSTPNLPSLTPVVYPTQSTYYFGFRRSGEPPWWPNGVRNWIDQN